MSSLEVTALAKAASLIPVSTIFSSIEIPDQQTTSLSSSLLPIPTDAASSSVTSFSAATFSSGSFESNASSAPIPQLSSTDTTSVVFHTALSRVSDDPNISSATDVVSSNSSNFPGSTQTSEDPGASASSGLTNTSSINPPPATDSQGSSISVSQSDSTVTPGQGIVLPTETTPIPLPSQDQTTSVSIPEENRSLSTSTQPGQTEVQPSQPTGTTRQPSSTEPSPSSTTDPLILGDTGTTTRIPGGSPSTSGEDTNHNTTPVPIEGSHTDGGTNPTMTADPGNVVHSDGTHPTPTPRPGGDDNTDGGTNPTRTPRPGDGDDSTGGGTNPTLTPHPPGGDNTGEGVVPTLTPRPPGGDDTVGGIVPTFTPPGGIEGSVSAPPVPPEEGSETQTSTTTTTTTSSEPPVTATPGVIYRNEGTDDAAATAFQISLPDKGVQNVDPWVFVNGWVYGWHGSFNDSVSAALSRDPMVSFIMPDGARREAVPQDLPDGAMAGNSTNSTPSASQRTSTPKKPRAGRDLKEVEPADFQLIGSQDPQANLLKLSRSKRMDRTDTNYDKFAYPKNIGDGDVYIVIIDSGLRPDLPEVIDYEKRRGTQIIWLVNDQSTEPTTKKDAEEGFRSHGSCVFFHAVSPTFGAAKNAKVVIMRDDGPLRFDNHGELQTLDFNVFARALQLTATWAQQKGGGPKIIINISSVMQGNTPAEQNSIDRMVNNLASTGVLMVAAAGNTGEEFDRLGNQRTPGERVVNTALTAFHDKYDSFMLVGSTDDDDQKSTFTSLEPDVGKTRIDVWAQGRDLQCPGEDTDPFPTKTKQGTSFAAPQVAGIAALLMLSKKPPTSAKLLKKKIMTLAWPRVNGGPPIAYNGIWGSNRRCWGLLPRQGQLMHDGTSSGTTSASSNDSSNSDGLEPNEDAEPCLYVSPPSTLTTITSMTTAMPTPVSCSPVNQDPQHGITSAYCICSSSVTLPENTGVTIPGFTWPQPNCAYTDIPTTTFKPVEQPAKVLTTSNCQVYYDQPQSNSLLADCQPTPQVDTPNPWLTCGWWDHLAWGEYWIWGGHWDISGVDVLGDQRGKNFRDPINRLDHFDNGISDVLFWGNATQFSMKVSAYGSMFWDVHFDQTFLSTMSGVMKGFNWNGLTECPKMN